ncbi:bucky ball-like [Salminus brasiliensis]|uniref:bucky ball-like n=1 Tax=Salminus brasiliensis TaxID=930266 RepID=UPI003B832D2A
MDEPNKASQSAGSGQSHQRPVTHSRPFFYVQPPMQPFYTYQWHMNNPYSHNVHGSGFHFGRPCMVPYSYLQYPGYVVPHAAVHPVDYRRIYERSFPPGTSAATYDFSFRQHQPSGTQKETTCSGAQTDPCEALNKLIECLDQLRAGEELHSRMDSQTSETLLPLAEEGKSEEETGVYASKKIDLSGSKTAETDTADCSWNKFSTQREKWPVSSEKEQLLENSSAEEEGCKVQEAADYLHQAFCVQSQNQPQDTGVSSDSPEKNRDEKVPDIKEREPRQQMEWEDSNVNWPSSQSSPVQPPSTRTTESQGTESAPADISGDYSCCILHLPFEKVLNTSVYGSGSTTRSLGSPFSYSYCPPQLSRERVSVLSPSLDELSSHDELLSTDLEDMGLFPTRIYARGRLAEVASRKSNPSVGEIHADMCVFYPKRLACSVCGSSVFKDHSRPKAFHCGTCCYGDADDSDEEAVEANIGGRQAMQTCKHCLGGTMTKIHTSKKPHQLSKHRFKHRAELEGRPGQTEATYTEHFYCEKCISPPEKSTGHSARGINTRLCKERRCRTMGIMSDQVVWESAGGNARPKACRAQPLPQRQERMSQRKSRLKPQGSRNGSTAADDGDDDDDDDEEEIVGEKEGTTKRGGVRC